MLYLTLTQPFDERFQLSIDAWFDLNADLNWLVDPLCKKWVKAIDKSDVIGPHLIESPVLGPISPEWLSGGVKMLIGLYKTDTAFDLRSCGENCSEFIMDIADIKDLHCACSYAMSFPVSEQRKIVIENDRSLITTEKELLRAYGRYDIW